MPIIQHLWGGDTDPIIFPLTLNGLPFDLSGVDHVALVKAGYDGKLQAAVTSGATVTIYDTVGGLVQWAQTADDLDYRYGPYRLYFRLYNTDGTYLTVPRDDHFLIYPMDPMT